MWLCEVVMVLDVIIIYTKILNQLWKCCLHMKRIIGHINGFVIYILDWRASSPMTLSSPHLFHMKIEGSSLARSTSIWCGSWCPLDLPHSYSLSVGPLPHAHRNMLDIYWMTTKKKKKKMKRRSHLKMTGQSNLLSLEWNSNSFLVSYISYIVYGVDRVLASCNLI